MKPIKDPPLYLPIRKVYFDEIIAGTKTTEYREIKDTTAKRYLLTNEQGGLFQIRTFRDQRVVST